MNFETDGQNRRANISLLFDQDCYGYHNVKANVSQPLEFREPLRLKWSKNQSYTMK